ncbi:hypothetical protein KFZ76_11980 [Methylovulum psychrotolerans]|uniref:hypothetical protein n=1 Tax=Methylovulum psychrotolerans TaxID=1704499 RepID=UPI001BFF2EAF|nr:hypothetical protein [Methylovulum psychrotolerans]MBT9098426.1 hypothetical protein [Methylovulum psychrotolerans]
MATYNCAQYVNQEPSPLSEKNLNEAINQLLPFFYKYHQIEAKKPELKKDKSHWMRWVKHWLDEFGDENIAKFKTVFDYWPDFIINNNNDYRYYSNKEHNPITMPTAFLDNLEVTTELPAVEIAPTALALPTAQAVPAALADMTLEEAQEAHNSLKNLQSVARKILLEIRDRKGWKALGYSSFAEYGEKEFGYDQTYIYRLAKAEEVQKTINSPLGELPETHLRELGRLPAADRQAVLDSVLAAGGKVTAKRIQEAVSIFKNALEASEIEKTQLRQQLDEIQQQQQEMATKLGYKIREGVEELLPTIENEIKQNFTESLEAKDDEIMRLRSNLNLQEFRDEQAELIAAKHNAQIELDKTKNELQARLTEQEVNNQYTSFANAISKNILDIMLELAVFTQDNKQVWVYPYTKSHLAIAAKNLLEASKQLDFLATGIEQDTILDN